MSDVTNQTKCLTVSGSRWPVRTSSGPALREAWRRVAARLLPEPPFGRPPAPSGPAPPAHSHRKSSNDPPPRQCSPRSRVCCSERARCRVSWPLPRCDRKRTWKRRCWRARRCRNTCRRRRRSCCPRATSLPPWPTQSASSRHWPSRCSRPRPRRCRLPEVSCAAPKRWRCRPSATLCRVPTCANTSTRPRRPRVFGWRSGRLMRARAVWCRCGRGRWTSAAARPLWWRE